jgi:hypothetical protein
MEGLQRWAFTFWRIEDRGWWIVVKMWEIGDWGDRLMVIGYRGKEIGESGVIVD